MNGTFTFSIDKQLIIKKEGPRGPFAMTRFLGLREADCFTSLKKTCLPYHCHYTMTKEKEGLRPPLFTTFRCHFFPSNAQGRMDALQANHERPANPHERAHPFSSVHPHGPPCESRAETPEPSCLESIAWNRGSNGKRNCDKLHIAGRRLPALANYSLNKCLKLFFFFPPLPLVLWRLLLWRLNPRAVSPRTTDQASTGAQQPMVNASTLTD